LRSAGAGGSFGVKFAAAISVLERAAFPELVTWSCSVLVGCDK
jgi:hypothetical protein